MAELCGHLLSYGLHSYVSRGIPPCSPAFSGPIISSRFLSYHPFAKSLSGGQITWFCILRPPMASYTPCSVLPASTMLWDSVAKHYAVCAHTPWPLCTPNTILTPHFNTGVPYVNLPHAPTLLLAHSVTLSYRYTPPANRAVQWKSPHSAAGRHRIAGAQM